MVSPSIIHPADGMELPQRKNSASYALKNIRVQLFCARLETLAKLLTTRDCSPNSFGAILHRIRIIGSAMS